MSYLTLEFASDSTLLQSLTTKLPMERIQKKTMDILMEEFDADECQIYSSDMYGRNLKYLKTIKRK